jgi:nicotinate phosphoribosyltransferase
MIYDESLPRKDLTTMVDFGDFGKRQTFDNKTKTEKITSEDLLVPILEAGNLAYRSPTIHQIRDRTASQLKSFANGILRFDNPQTYPVGLEVGLHERKASLIRSEQIKSGRSGNE